MQNRPIMHRGIMVTDGVVVKYNGNKVLSKKYKKSSKDKKLKKESKKETKKETKDDKSKIDLPKNITKFANNLSNVINYNIIEKIGEGAMGIAYKLTDSNGNCIIKKTYKGMDKKDRRFKGWCKSFINEVTILVELLGEPHFPQLLYYDMENYEIYMTFCGQKINDDNVPANWKIQLIEILDVLKKHNIAHNSTALNNTCIYNDIIYFIDFASSGKYGSRKRNLTRDIINNAKNIHDVFDSNKTRHNRSGQKSDLLN